MQEMQTVSIEEVEILPAFCENNVALLFAVSENYIPYFSTVLQSILENSSTAYNYDIIVFHRNILKESINIIHKQCINYPNFSVRFYNILPVMEPYMDLHILGHFTIEMYFRLLAPFILKAYDKILYLDSDILVVEDVAKLYILNLAEECLLAGSRDADFSAGYNRHRLQRKYCKKILKLSKPFDYFQSGVLLLNLDAFRKCFTSTYILDFARTQEWHYPDQDILNILAQGRVLFIDMQWNMIVNWRNKRLKNIKKYAPKEQCNDYLLAREKPYIIHYAGPDKPWYLDRSDFAEIWWEYAKKTYYEATLKNNLLLYQKEQKKFKNRVKRFVKKIAMPLVNLFFPYGSKVREKLKKKFGSS